MPLKFLKKKTRKNHKHTHKIECVCVYLWEFQLKILGSNLKAVFFVCRMVNGI